MKAALFSAALALAAAISIPAHADSRSEAEQAQDAVRARARALFEKGAAAFDAHKLEDARGALTESFGIYPSYDTAGLLGQTEIDLGQYVSAATHLDYCLRHFPTGENAELLKQVKVAFSAVQNQVGTLQVDVDVDGAEVSVDGAVVGKSPLGRKVFVDPGTHTVRVTAKGKEPFERALSVAKGDDEVVTASFGSDAGAMVPATAATNSESPATTPAEPPSERNWVPAYILGGVTVASLATSLVFRGLASGDADDVDKLRADAPAGGCSGASSSSSQCTSLSDAVEGHDQKADISNVSLLIAGVGAVATAGYVTYTLLQPTEETPVKASVGFDGSAGRLLVSGSF